MFGIEIYVSVNDLEFTLIPKRRFKNIFWAREYVEKLDKLITSHVYKIWTHTCFDKNDTVTIDFSKFKARLLKAYNYFSKEEIEILFWKCFDYYSRLNGIHSGVPYVIVQCCYV